MSAPMTPGRGPVRGPAAHRRVRPGDGRGPEARGARRAPGEKRREVLRCVLVPPLQSSRVVRSGVTDAGRADRRPGQRGAELIGCPVQAAGPEQIGGAQIAAYEPHGDGQVDSAISQPWPVGSGSCNEPAAGREERWDKQTLRRYPTREIGDPLAARYGPLVIDGVGSSSRLSRLPTQVVSPGGRWEE
jgi:hypothetical protein